MKSGMTDSDWENRIEEMVTELCDHMDFDWTRYDDDSYDIQDVLLGATEHVKKMKAVVDAAVAWRGYPPGGKGDAILMGALTAFEATGEDDDEPVE